ncbi:MAG: hypothetical protein ACE5J9_05480 [Methanosarcinales archaeon]
MNTKTINQISQIFGIPQERLIQKSILAYIEKELHRLQRIDAKFREKYSMDFEVLYEKAKNLASKSEYQWLNSKICGISILEVEHDLEKWEETLNKLKELQQALDISEAL